MARPPRNARTCSWRSGFGASGWVLRTSPNTNIGPIRADKLVSGDSDFKVPRGLVVRDNPRQETDVLPRHLQGSTELRMSGRLDHDQRKDGPDLLVGGLVGLDQAQQICLQVVCGTKVSERHRL